MDEYRTRRNRVSAVLSEHKLEALLVTYPANVRYLTGFTGSNGLLLVLPESAVFFTDPRYQLQSEQQVSCASRVVKGALAPVAAEYAVQKKISTLGVEADAIHYDVFQALSQKISLTPVHGIVQAFRAVKSETELGLIRQSVQTNSKALERALRAVKAGMTETDLAAEIEYRMRRLGAEKAAFDTIVAAGKHGALPHAQPGSKKIQNGQLVLIDMGVMENGYASDMTRMVHLGPVPRKTKKLYQSVLEAQLAALDAVKAGATGAAVDRAARQVLKKEGLGKAFLHSTGHGLGLEIHENPRIAKTSETVLEAGMAITIEPGIYLPGWGGIRIEDTVVVTASGCEVLTPTSKELREI